MAKSKINGGFIVIPKNTLRCNQWKELKHTTKLVYVTMLTEFIRDKKLNPEHKLKISQKQIEIYTGLCHPTVVSAIKELKKHKFITVSWQGGLEENCSEYIVDPKYVY